VDEALHLIGTEEPCRPSERLRGSESLPSVASRRQIEPHRLADLLRGELDWIVMKALEKDRSQRYESAAALARDIENYLADRPVSAGPPSAGYRVRKYVRRNRHMLAMTATLMTVLVLGAGVALQKAVLAKREAARADVERARAQATLRAALRAVNELYIGVADKHLMATPMREPMKLDLLRGAARFYASIAGMHASDIEFRHERAVARSRLGSAYQWLGMLEAAQSEHLQAVEEMRRLAEESPDQITLQLELAHGYLELGHVLTARAKPVRAETAYQRSLALLAPVGERRPTDPGYLLRLASARRALGCHMLRVRRYDVAEEHLRAATAAFEQLIHLMPQDMSRRFHAAQAFRDLADVLAATGRDEEADARYRKSIDLQKESLAAPPIDADGVLHLALTHTAYGDFCERLGRVEEAESQHRQSLVVSSELAESFPHVPAFRDAWRNSYFHLVQLLARGKYSANATRSLEEVIQLAGHLVTRWPTVASFQQQLCHAYIDLGHLMHGEGRSFEAEWLLRSAMVRAEQLATEHGDDPATRALLARSRWHLGAVLRFGRRFEEAEQAFCEAMMFSEQLVAEIPLNDALYLEMSLVEQSAAEMLQEAGRRQEAERHYLRCIAIQERLAAENIDDHREYLARSHAGLAALLLDVGRDQEAESHYRRAIGLVEDLIGRFPRAVLYQDRMAEMLGGLLRVANRRLARGDQQGGDELLDSIDAITRRALDNDQMGTLRVLYRIATTRFEQQQYEAARAVLTEVLETHQRVLTSTFPFDDPPPLHHTARMNALAWLLANCPDSDLRNPRDAVAWATRAVECDPGNGMYLNTLGVALCRAGDAEQAIVVLRRAVDLSFGTAADFFFLSLAHCHQGRLGEGLEWHRQAVDWMERNDPDNPELLLMRAESEQLLGTWGVASVR
jgi:tetratricopeptide (TPR) repeat protein